MTNVKKETDGSCLICSRINDIQRGENPHFVAELETGYVVLGDYQFFKGYTLFLCKQHRQELHELSVDFRKQHLWEMSQVAEAVYTAFQPTKLNYELLGNTDRHIHWHIFPRHADDTLPNRTVWNIPREIRNAESEKPTETSLQQLRNALKKSLYDIIRRIE